MRKLVSWLRNHDLEEYCESLVSEGITSVGQICRLTDAELDDMFLGINARVSHAARFHMAIQETISHHRRRSSRSDVSQSSAAAVSVQRPLQRSRSVFVGNTPHATAGQERTPIRRQSLPSAKPPPFDGIESARLPPPLFEDSDQDQQAAFKGVQIRISQDDPSSSVALLPASSSSPVRDDEIAEYDSDDPSDLELDLESGVAYDGGHLLHYSNSSGAFKLTLIALLALFTGMFCMIHFTAERPGTIFVFLPAIPLFCLGLFSFWNACRGASNVRMTVNPDKKQLQVVFSNCCECHDHGHRIVDFSKFIIAKVERLSDMKGSCMAGSGDQSQCRIRFLVVDESNPNGSASFTTRIWGDERKLEAFVRSINHIVWANGGQKPDLSNLPNPEVKPDCCMFCAACGAVILAV